VYSNKVRIGLFAATLLTGLSFQEAKAADTFDIDVILPLTGGAAFLGKAEQQSLTLYQQVVKDSGGIHGKELRFVFHDDQSNPQTAVQIVNQIKASSPSVIIGSAVAGLCNAMSPLMRNGPVMYCLSPSLYAKPGDYAFSSSVSTKGLVEGLLRYFKDRGWNKIGLITSTDASGQDAYKQIKSVLGEEGFDGLQIVAEAQFNPTDVSASAQVQHIKGAGPDAVIVWSTGAPVGTVFKAIRDAGLQLPIGTTDGNMTYAQMEQYASFLPKELYIPSPMWLPMENGKQTPAALAAKKAFFDVFKGTDIKPDGPSTFAWDPALLVVSALRALPEGVNAKQLRDHLADLQGFNGINGVYDFKRDPQRGLDKSSVVVTRWDVEAGTWKVVSDVGGALAKQ